MQKTDWAVPVLLMAVSLAGLPGCRHERAATAATPGVHFGTGEVRILSAADTFLLHVEIAETSRQMRTGLKRRPELPENAGMLFLFEREQGPRSGFWMYRTPVPLSIAFLDAEGTIRAIRDMEPCTSWLSFRCRSYRAGVPYHAALEVNRGYFTRRGIGVGDRVILRRE